VTQKTILVLNPAANAAMTRRIDATLSPLRFAGGPRIVCDTLEGSPKSIGSQSEVDAVAPLVRARIAGDNSADAYVIACYADPGLAASREATTRPVFGIAEAGIMTALARGDRFGVMAVKTTSIPRHLGALRKMGVIDRLAGERGLDLDGEADDARTLDRMCSVGLALKHDGADVLVIGCAGLGHLRAQVEQHVGLPVIDPPQAGVAMAITTIVGAMTPYENKRTKP